MGQGIGLLHFIYSDGKPTITQIACILRVSPVDLDCRYPKYHNFSEVPHSLYMLEISQVLKQFGNMWYIADTCNSALTTGIDDITGFRRHGKP